MGQIVVIVPGVHHGLETELFQVVQTLGLLGGGTGFAEGGQEHGGKDGYNSDDHGYCYEGKRRVFLMQ